MKIDWWLVMPIVLLTILGLVLLISVAPDLVISQLIFTAIAVAVFVAISYIDYRLLFSLNIPIYIASIIFITSPFVFGTHSRGALRWLQLGDVFIQPSELTKAFLLITFAWVSVCKWPYRKIWLLLTGLLPAVLVFLQPDLGTTLIIVVGWGAIFLRSLPWRMSLGVMFLALAILPIGWFGLHDYQKDRLQTFINPYRDPLGRGYHVIQSLIAVGSGKIMGRGLGHGTQSSLRFLPERHTDFIFASLAEELGFVGAFLCLVLYAILLWRLDNLTRQITDLAHRQYVFGVEMLLLFQIFVNIGMNMGLVPVTGVTLPLVSYGGSSQLSLAILLGLVHSIAIGVKDLNHQLRIG